MPRRVREQIQGSSVTWGGVSPRLSREEERDLLRPGLNKLRRQPELLQLSRFSHRYTKRQGVQAASARLQVPHTDSTHSRPIPMLLLATHLPQQPAQCPVPSCKPLSHLGEVKPVQWVALLLHLLHSACLLPKPFCFLGQIQIQDGHSSRLDVYLRQRVHHQHHPHWPLPLPVACNGIEEVVCIQPLAPLVWCHPRWHHEFDIFQVPLEPAVDVTGQQVLKVLPLWQQLAAGESRDGVGVGEVQLKVHYVTLLKGLLGVLWDEIPDTGVWDMDGAKEVRWGISLDGPQKGVQFSLPGKREIQLSICKHSQQALSRRLKGNNLLTQQVTWFCSLPACTLTKEATHTQQVLLQYLFFSGLEVKIHLSLIKSTFH